MKLSPQTVKKYSLKNKNLQYLNLDDIELAFCHHCTAVAALVPEVYSFDYANASREQLDKLTTLTHTASALLEASVKPYLPTDPNNPRLAFSKEHFVKNSYLSNTYTNMVAEHMGFVAYYECVHMGYKLENFNSLNGNKMNAGLVNHYSYHSAEDVANSIDVKARKNEREL